MKRWLLTANEEQMMQRLLGEYILARKARTRALAGLARVQYDIDTDTAVKALDRAIYAEQLAAAREIIRLTTDLVALMRTQR